MQNIPFSVFPLKCREIGCEIHDEVLKVLHELLTAMKTHQTYRSEFRQSQSKFQVRYIYTVGCRGNYLTIVVLF
jgi:hypothetical protein